MWGKSTCFPIPQENHRLVNPVFAKKYFKKNNKAQLQTKVVAFYLMFCQKQRVTI